MMIAHHESSIYGPVKPRRTHEVMGTGQVCFAAALAGRIGGQSLWMQERWLSETLNPWGLAEFFDPKNMLFAQAKTQIDLLASAEEALRSGAIKLVVYKLTAPLSLTAGRRLQLAADAGKSTGLALIQDGMGSNATHTRWRCSPVFHELDSTLYHWEIIKNKSGTNGSWHVRWNSSSRSIIVVPPAGDRPGS